MLDGMTDAPVAPDEIKHALRSLRPMMYRVETTDSGTTVALVMNASESGRKNAAGKIVRLLGEHGLELDASSPTEAMTSNRDGFVVRRLG
jgi:hypothetical protein